jgi:membrane protein implicated in regulation of membrane protease activity
MESDYIVVILVAFVGFVALAAMLLVPIWRFLRREEEVAKRWTPGKSGPPVEQRTNGEEPNRTEAGAGD